MSPDSGPTHPRWLFAFTALSAVGVLALGASVEQGDLPGAGYRFLGRFHPLVVHLPIGVLLLIAGLELLTLRPAWRNRIDPVLGLLQVAALVTSVLAFVLGVLLSGAGGYSESLLGEHKRLVLAAVVLQSLALFVYVKHRTRASEPLRQLYRGALGACVAALGIGAHFGGSLTHGEGYLLRYAPSWLKAVAGKQEPEKTREPSKASTAAAADPLVFQDVVLPVLDKYCVSCHGPEKSKAELRLDSYEALKRGGESGVIVEPGAPEKSTLVRVMALPEGHDDRMPPEGKPAPNAAERELVAWWILRGARKDERVREVLPPSSVVELLKTQIARAEGEGNVSEPPLRSAPLGAPDASAMEAAATPTEDDSQTPETATPLGVDSADADLASAPEEEMSVSVRANAQRAFSVLAARCASCHGAAKQKGSLRVDSLAALRRGGKQGPAVLPGRPGASPLLRRVRLPIEDDEHMPPKNKPQLTAEEVQLLSDWIQGLGAGAPVSVAVVEDAGELGVSSVGEASEPSGTVADTEASPEPTISQPRVAAAESLTSELPPLSQAEFARLPSTVHLYKDVVEPLLHTACGECHIGDPVMGGLSVATYDDLMQSGTVVAGQPSNSELLARVLLPEVDDDRMPPEGMDPLSPAQAGSLSFWIQQGAESDGAWEKERLPTAVAHALLHRLQPKLADAVDRAEPETEGQLADVRVRDAGCAACSVATARGSSSLWAALFLWISASLWRRSTLREHRQLAGEGDPSTPSALARVFQRQVF